MPDPSFREDLQQHWNTIVKVEAGEVGLSPDQRGKHNNYRLDNPGHQEPPDLGLGPPYCEPRY